MNPILPFEHHVPDVEAKIFADGKLYMYGSYDLPCGTVYCSDKYNVFSSADLESFEVNENVFTSAAAGEPDKRLYAPDCVEYRGRYYLFYCLDDGSEGVAVSESPEGPFKDAQPVTGADKTGIDPTVLVDDDG